MKHKIYGFPLSISAFLMAIAMMGTSATVTFASAEQVPDIPNTPTTPNQTAPTTDTLVFPPTTPDSETTALRTAEEIAPTANEGAPLADARAKEAQDVEPLSLVDAIVTTLKNNPQRESALGALQAAQSRVRTAKANAGIQASLSGNLGYNRYYGGGGISTGDGTGTGTNVFINTAGSQSYGLDVSIPIYNGGQNSASKRSAFASAEAQAASTLQVEQQLVESTITAYLDVLRNEQLVEVAQNNLDVVRERRRVAGERYRVGNGARLDVLSSNTDLATARQTRIEASNAYAQSKGTLNVLLGRAPETPVRLLEVTALTPSVPLSVEDASKATMNSSSQLRTVAEQSNPTIASNRAQIDAALADVDVAKAARKPSVALSIANTLSNPVRSLGRFLLSLGLNASQTLFDSGKAKSQIYEAQGLVTQAKANLKNQELSVASAIDNQLLALDSAQERLNNANEAVLEAQQALVAAQAAYTAGARTRLEVTNAQVSLLTTQTDAANARFDVANSQAQLSSAVGILTEEGQQAYKQVMEEETEKERELMEKAKQIAEVNDKKSKKLKKVKATKGS
ncbi:TolC family protein [bacterium]|nr:MAG: TolC family protein [bacterium]